MFKVIGEKNQRIAINICVGITFCMIVLMKLFEYIKELVTTYVFAIMLVLKTWLSILVRLPTASELEYYFDRNNYKRIMFKSKNKLCLPCLVFNSCYNSCIKVGVSCIIRSVHGPMAKRHATRLRHTTECSLWHSCPLSGQGTAGLQLVFVEQGGQSRDPQADRTCPH